MHYMDDQKRMLLSKEEIAYAKDHGAIFEEERMTKEKVIASLTQSLSCISLQDAAEAFLYSLSTRDLEYRYLLASYLYAQSWMRFDQGKTDRVMKHFSKTFYQWVKYCGGGIWGEIGKPTFYLSMFLQMEKHPSTEKDRTILREILTIANTMDDTATAITLCKQIQKQLVFPSNKKEVIGILETLAICGILETPQQRGYLDTFTPPLLRDTKDMRQSLSYPLNWWRGKHKVNKDHLFRIFQMEL